jgi:hypothetical protein
MKDVYNPQPVIEKIFNFKLNYYKILNFNSLKKQRGIFYKYKTLFFKPIKKKKLKIKSKRYYKRKYYSKYNKLRRKRIRRNRIHPRQRAFFKSLKRKAIRRKRHAFKLLGIRWFFDEEDRLKNKIKKKKKKSFFIKIRKYLSIKKLYFKVYKIRSYYKKLYKKRRYKRFKRYKILKLYKYNYKRFFKFVFKRKKIGKKFNFLPDELELVDLLRSTFNLVKTDRLKNIFGFIYIKSSGINTFITITAVKGNVLHLILLVFLRK